MFSEERGTSDVSVIICNLCGKRVACGGWYVGMCGVCWVHDERMCDVLRMCMVDRGCMACSGVLVCGSMVFLYVVLHVGMCVEDVWHMRKM